MEERDQALIESYLANELSVEEKSQVEQRIQEDAAFRDLLNAYRTAVDALKQGERDRLKAHFIAREKVLDRGSAQPARVSLRWVMATAAILLLGFLGWKFLLNDQGSSVTPSQEQLDRMFAENFSPFLQDMSDPAVRGDTATALEQFNIDYWTGHYQDAALRFKTLADSLQQNQGLRFRYANALLANKQYAEAKIVFEDLAAHGPSLHSNEAVWYLALIEIHEGDVPNAKAHLKKYKTWMNPLYGRQAYNLLRQLGN